MWEYQCLFFAVDPDWNFRAQEQLNMMGAEGWEAFAFHLDAIRAVFWLKRPKPETRISHSAPDTSQKD